MSLLYKPCPYWLAARPAGQCGLQACSKNFSPALNPFPVLLPLGMCYLPFQESHMFYLQHNLPLFERVARLGAGLGGLNAAGGVPRRPFNPPDKQARAGTPDQNTRCCRQCVTAGWHPRNPPPIAAPVVVPGARAGGWPAVVPVPLPSRR